MPNWIKGTMKLRGKREDIARFFREGLDASNRHKLEDQVKDDSGEDYLWFHFVNNPHIAGTRRAFIDDDYVEMYDDIGVACVDIKQAWAFDAGSESEDLQKWKNISEKYNVDIRLYGIECGMQFTQEIIIVRGRKPIVNVKQYENWDWDCPFPNMGGRVMSDLIDRRTAIDALGEGAMVNYQASGHGNGLIKAIDVIKDLPSAQPEPLTDKEQRIFLAAMGREEKVCEEVDRNYVREPYADSLVRVCKEIRRKVKGALWI